MCRHGQTVLLAVALSSKEGTSDYEWALGCYLQAAGAPPAVVLTDADPGATAAVASVFPKALHLWCLWHIHQNLRKQLGSKLGPEFQNFVNDFRSCQMQLSETIFWQQYQQLQRAWPEAAPYLEEQLTGNVRFWAGFRHTCFTTGALSTQRGEGINRHFKQHLSGQSPLSKFYEEVILKEAREAARLVVATAKDEVTPPLTLPPHHSLWPAAPSLSFLPI